MFFQEKPVIHLNRRYSDCSVHVGDPVRVEAEVSGYPSPVVTWLLNDEDLINNEDVKIEKNKTRYRMVITKAAIRHSGSYTIKATNYAGEDQKDFQISVPSKTHDNYLIFINHLYLGVPAKIVIPYIIVTYLNTFVTTS